MKAILNSKMFLLALTEAKKAIESNPVIPIIENYLLSFRDRTLTVSGTDLQTTVSLSYHVEHQGNFDAVLAPPALKYLAKIEEQPITLEYDPGNYAVIIHEEGARAKYAGENFQDFPRVPQAGIKCLNLEATTLAELKDLLNYVSTDGMRVAMSSVHFGYLEGKLNLAGTDGHTLKIVTDGEQTTKKKGHVPLFNLPAKAARILHSFKIDGDVIVTTGRNSTTEPKAVTNVGFAFTTVSGFDVQVITRNIDEQYPDYWKVVPKQTKTKFTTDNKALLKTLDKTIMFANVTTHQIRIKLEVGEASINAEDLDFSNEYSAKLGGSYTGPEIEIGFNGVFLRRCLQSFGEEVVLELTEPNKAGVIRDERSLVLLMPVMLNQYV